jgi:GTP cyclohydrolase I
MDKKSLPDVALQKIKTNNQSLDFVGMSGISVPMKLAVENQSIDIICRVQAGVNLQTSAKGIHMSRIYNALNSYLSDKTITLKLLEDMLKHILQTHQGLSDYAQVRFSFEYRAFRRSLLSENYGWRTYPIDLIAHLKDDKMTLQLAAEIMYSSTCPCSAALSRQLIQNKFLADFTENQSLNIAEVAQWLGQEENICATPHSQRSAAIVTIDLENLEGASLNIIAHIIKDIEDTLGTVVQASVKREDEQEFARLNAKNLMFCEDSARKLKNLLANYTKIDIASYYVRVEHYESLHEHDAVAEFSG